MANKVELRARLDFWQAALKKLRTAYLALWMAASNHT